MHPEEHISLQPFNTFGIDVSAERFFRITSIEDAHEFVSKVAQRGEEYLLVGGGSNLLLTRDISTVAVVQLHGRTIVQQDEENVRIVFGAGENWHGCVTWAVEQGWGGIENLALIPGTIGAAPIQNIGAYGVELTEVFEYLEYIDLRTNTAHRLSHHDCAFGYRDSVFKHELKQQCLITSVCLRLSKKPTINAVYKDVEIELSQRNIAVPTVRDVYDAVVAIRRRKLPDPKEIGNAGSFFKNPVVEPSLFAQIALRYHDVPHYLLPDSRVKLPAAWLIDRCGYKGVRRGAVGVHRNQALVLVNYGGAKGSDVYALATEIQQQVEQHFGIGLEMEVNII